MDRGIYVALSGAVLQEKRMEVLTDNLANVNTAGYKKLKPAFEDAMPNASGTRTFAQLNDVVIDMSQGVTEDTGRPLDMAIKGEGFFVVKTPQGNRYTRDGSFTLAKDGTLQTREGMPVLGENGVIRLTGSDVSVDATGNIKENGAVTGKMKLVTFKNMSGLKREGNFFATADPNLKEMPVSPSTQVAQGYIEVSNVNAIRAMTTMIEAMRSYETHSKMIETLNDMTKKAVNEVGRNQ